MLIPINIPTGSIQDKEIEYVIFSFLNGSWQFIVWFHCGFCKEKQRNIWDVYRFGHFQTSDASGRNMAVELDIRHPLLPKLDGKMKI